MKACSHITSFACICVCLPVEPGGWSCWPARCPTKLWRDQFKANTGSNEHCGPKPDSALDIVGQLHTLPAWPGIPTLLQMLNLRSKI